MIVRYRRGRAGPGMLWSSLERATKTKEEKKKRNKKKLVCRSICDDEVGRSIVGRGSSTYVALLGAQVVHRGGNLARSCLASDKTQPKNKQTDRKEKRGSKKKQKKTRELVVIHRSHRSIRFMISVFGLCSLTTVGIEIRIVSSNK